MPPAPPNPPTQFPRHADGSYNLGDLFVRGEQFVNGYMRVSATKDAMRVEAVSTDDGRVFDAVTLLPPSTPAPSVRRAGGSGTRQGSGSSSGTTSRSTGSSNSSISSGSDGSTSARGLWSALRQFAGAMLTWS